MESLIDLNICRLCLASEFSLSNIFEPSNEYIADVLSKHIGEVTKDDVLPKFICSVCLEKVTIFHEFYSDVHAGQQNFIENLVKQENHSRDDDVANCSLAMSVNVEDELIDDLGICNVILKPDPQMECEQFMVDESNYTENAVLVDQIESEDDEQSVNLDNKKKRKLRGPYVKRFETFTCDICGWEMKTLSRLRQHMQVHVKRILKRTTCRFCEKQCQDMDELMQHIKEAHDDVTSKVRGQLKKLLKYLRTTEIDTEQSLAKYFDLKCDHCTVNLTSLEEAKKHYLDKHEIADGYIKCCGRPFKKKIKIRYHILWHMRPELFKCSVCFVQLASLEGFKIHIDTQHMKTGFRSQLITCNECGKSMLRRNFSGHMQLHRKNNPDSKDLATIQMEEGLKKFFDMKCDECEMEFDNFKHAQEHYEEHGINDGYIKCCGQQYRQLKLIKEHLAFHLNPEAFKCPVCSRVFKHRKNMSTCMNRHRSIKRGTYKCDICEQSLPCRYTLARHKEKHLEKILPCEQCSRVFKTEKNRLAHIQRVHEKLPTAQVKNVAFCEFCAKAFDTMAKLDYHIKSKHTQGDDEKLECDICKKLFSNCHTLKAHMERHTSGPRQCPHCNKQSPNASALNQHIKIVHTMPARHQCHLCSKAFKVAGELTDHIASHTNSRSFSCSYCSETFNWRQNMYKHQKKMHPIEWQANRK